MRVPYRAIQELVAKKKGNWNRKGNAEHGFERSFYIKMCILR